MGVGVSRRRDGVRVRLARVLRALGSHRRL